GARLERAQRLLGEGGELGLRRERDLAPLQPERKPRALERALEIGAAARREALVGEGKGDDGRNRRAGRGIERRVLDRDVAQRVAFVFSFQYEFSDLRLRNANAEAENRRLFSFFRFFCQGNVEV